MQNNKTYIIVLRHGRCHEDKLTKTGQTNVHSTTIALKEAGFYPDLIITSPTGRTIESTSIVREHFNKVSSLREYPLWFEKSQHMNEITDLLSAIPSEHRTVYLSGHAETVNSFTFHLLDKEPDCSKLFKIVRPEDYEPYMSGEKECIYTSAAMGDALILEAETQEEQNLADMQWRFHGYVLNGKLTLAQDIEAEPLPGRKMDVQKNFPLLAFERN